MFCQEDSPKPENIQMNIIQHKKDAKVFTFEKLKPVIFWYFGLKIFN